MAFKHRKKSFWTVQSHYLPRFLILNLNLFFTKPHTYQKVVEKTSDTFLMKAALYKMVVDVIAS